MDFFEHRMDIEWYRYLASLHETKEPDKLATVHSLADSKKHEQKEMPREEKKAS